MIVNYYGLGFDTETREVLGSDGMTVLSEGEFRSFPLIPTSKGLDAFKRIWNRAFGGGFTFTTKLGLDNGQPALLVSVGVKDDLLVEDHPFGKTLETKIRHQSEQAAAMQLKDDVRAFQLEKKSKENQ